MCGALVSDPSTEKRRLGEKREKGVGGGGKRKERNENCVVRQVVPEGLVSRGEVCIPNIVLLILLTFCSSSRKVDGP